MAMVARGGLDPRHLVALGAASAPWAGVSVGQYFESGGFEQSALAALGLALALLLVLALLLRRAMRREGAAIERLSQSERRFRLLAEHAPDVVFRVRFTPAPVVDYLSPSVEAVTGYSAEQFLSDPTLYQRAMHPDDRRAPEELVRLLTTTPDLTLRWMRPDGRVVWTELHQRPQHDAQGRLEAVEGIARDVTRARRAEEALRENERALATLLGNLPGVAYRLQLSDGQPFDFLSAGIHDLTGYDPEEFSPEGTVHFADLIHPDDRARVRSEVLRAVEGRARFTVSFRIVTKTGEERWVWDRGVGIYDQKGRAVAIEGFTCDVTERRRTEELRDRLYREAEEAVSAREGFLSMATHDLRSPLTALKLQVQSQMRRLARLPLADETAIQALKRIDGQVARMQQFVDELLDVTRAQAGRLEVRLEEMDLTALVREVAARLQAHAEQAGCDVRLSAPGPVVGRWDWLRLEQVVMNLLSNSFKYGDGKPVQVSVEVAGERARLVVRDQGIGLEPHDQDRLFQRFERLSAEHRVGSTGLGLWIVRLVVEALGGTIRCASEGRGQGTTFVVDLPRSGPPAQAAAPRPEPLPAAQPPLQASAHL